MGEEKECKPSATSYGYITWRAYMKGKEKSQCMEAHGGYCQLKLSTCDYKEQHETIIDSPTTFTLLRSSSVPPCHAARYCDSKSSTTWTQMYVWLNAAPDQPTLTMVLAYSTWSTSEALNKLTVNELAVVASSPISSNIFSA